MNNSRTSIIRQQIPNFANVCNKKMCASTYNNNMIIKVEKNMSNMTPKSLTFDDYVIILSPALTDKALKSHFSCGDLNKSLIVNLLIIIHLLISARQLFNFEIAPTAGYI